MSLVPIYTPGRRETKWSKVPCLRKQHNGWDRPWLSTEDIKAGLKIATDTVAIATNIFSLASKNSGLVAKVATRFQSLWFRFKLEV